MVTTSVTIAGLRLKNRVLVASGTFGYGDEAPELVDIAKLGGVVTKSLSLKPRGGNAPWRIVETPSGMLNSIGLANIGVRKFIEEKLPALRAKDTAVVANIAAGTVDEYAAVLDLLEAEEGIHAYEINVSCPNVREGGLSFGTSREMTAALTRHLRARTRKPLWIKLTPNVAHISEFARAVEAEGADAVSVINTLIGMAVDIRKRKPVLSTVTGGLSGPAIKPVALAKVFETARAVKIPVIGIGGIMNAQDAIEFLMAGASAVQVGTANFIDPATGVHVAEGIRAFCEEQKIADTAALVGCLDARVDASALASWL
jgi:dihydroorotate dehydrogenase (NAD+) catalytic subunit